MERPLENTPLQALEEMRRAALAMAASQHFETNRAEEALAEIDAEMAARE